MSQPSAGKIPFSWERKPGISKVTIAESFQREHKFVPRLQPPPCTTEAARNSVRDFQIPLPPCAFQPPYYGMPSKKDLNWMQDHDPFFAAYKECTKSTKSAERNNKLLKNGIETKLRNSMFFFSCKRSCAVRDNNFVRITYLPHNLDKD
ncbi:uncharacterized protein LOC133314543 [Gastrolobium bilobum]|uniref:uncharacterized protein LOC133314543 n=1 Tax=Gastrolobium bilobum TaxID=150636 RepID=UPI002AAF298D|nr:uncharacterized protein LOC133314543 [Gastrolobium bilobum]